MGYWNYLPLFCGFPKPGLSQDQVCVCVVHLTFGRLWQQLVGRKKKEANMIPWSIYICGTSTKSVVITMSTIAGVRVISALKISGYIIEGKPLWNSWYEIAVFYWERDPGRGLVQTSNRWYKHFSHFFWIYLFEKQVRKKKKARTDDGSWVFNHNNKQNKVQVCPTHICAPQQQENLIGKTSHHSKSAMKTNHPV